MNYLAHSLRFLHDPARLAGVCLPDWLRVIDKRRRITAVLLAAADQRRPASPADVAFADGVMQHHHDDEVFHTLPTFEALCDEAVHAFRALDDDPRLRASMLGHVTVELLLDAAILEADQDSGTQFYEACAAIDVDALTTFVEATTQKPLPQLPVLLERFCRARFVFAYASDDGLCRCLNGVLSHLALPDLPRGSSDVVSRLRPQVARELPTFMNTFAPRVR